MDGYSFALYCRERQLEAARSAAQQRRAEEDAEEDRIEEEARQQRSAEEEAARQAEEARVKVMCHMPNLLQLWDSLLRPMVLVNALDLQL